MPAVPSASHQRLYTILLFCVAVVMLVPIWAVDYPGMVDYPNHLVRCYILAHYHSVPAWQQTFYILHGPLPDLAIDLIASPLSLFLPLILSGKIFLTLNALLYLTGCVVLGRAILGKTNWIAPLVAMTFYNSLLMFGWVNCMFGMGMFLCTFALWLSSRKRMSWPRFAALCVLSLLVFLSHISGVAFLGLSCVTVALIEWPTHRSFSLLVRQLAWLFCPVILMLAFMHHSGAVGVVEWSSLTRKIIFFFAPIHSYTIAFDIPIILALFVCLIVIGRRSTFFRPTMIAGAVMFFFYLVIPNLFFGSSAADARFVLPGFLLVLLSIDTEWRQAQKAALAVAILTMFVRTADITANWINIDHRERHVLSMGDNLPTGARVYAYGHLFNDTRKLDRGFYQVIEFWSISHQAYINQFFAVKGVQPIVFREPICDIGLSPQCANSYDYIWTHDPPADTEKFVRSVADPVSVWETVTLWRVRR